MDKRDAVDDSWEAIERRTALLLSELERLDGPSALAAPTQGDISHIQRPLSLINQDNPCLTLLATI